MSTGVCIFYVFTNFLWRNLDRFTKRTSPRATAGGPGGAFFGRFAKAGRKFSPKAFSIHALANMAIMWYCIIDSTQQRKQKEETKCISSRAG